MKITKLRITSTSGANARPRSGYATFSDGKYYDWQITPEGDIRFFVVRHVDAARVLASFASAARAAALRAELEA